MPKQKTHSGAKKRFKITGTGKLVAPARHEEPHHLEGQSKKVKRDFDKDIPRRQGGRPDRQEASRKGLS